jgi:hypothetical protein
MLLELVGKSCGQRFGFQQSAHLGCLTMDNASNNDILVTVLAEFLKESAVGADLETAVDWNPEESRIRCFPTLSI